MGGRGTSLKTAEDEFLLDVLSTTKLIRQINLCINCSFIFQNPTYSSLELKRLYGEKRVNIIGFYRKAGKAPGDLWESDKAQSLNEERRRFYANWIIEKRASKVLDYGGGSGENLADERLSGIVRYTWNFGEDADSKSEVKVVRSLSECGIVDAVIHTHVLEHEPVPIIGLKWLRKISKSNGWLMLEVPFDYFERLITRRPGAVWHVNHFNRSTLARLLNRAGWSCKNIELSYRSYQNRNQLCFVLECQPSSYHESALSGSNYFPMLIDFAKWLFFRIRSKFDNANN